MKRRKIIKMAMVLIAILGICFGLYSLKKYTIDMKYKYHHIPSKSVIEKIPWTFSKIDLQMYYKNTENNLVKIDKNTFKESTFNLYYGNTNQIYLFTRGKLVKQIYKSTIDVADYKRKSIEEYLKLNIPKYNDLLVRLTPNVDDQNILLMLNNYFGYNVNSDISSISILSNNTSYPYPSDEEIHDYIKNNVEADQNNDYILADEGIDFKCTANMFFLIYGIPVNSEWEIEQTRTEYRYYTYPRRLFFMRPDAYNILYTKTFTHLVDGAIEVERKYQITE